MELTDDQLLALTDEQAEAASLTDEQKERRRQLIAERDASGGSNNNPDDPEESQPALSQYPNITDVWSPELITVLNQTSAGDTISDDVVFSHSVGSLTFSGAYIIEELGIPVLKDVDSGILCTPFGYMTITQNAFELRSAMTPADLMYFIQLAKTWTTR